MRSQIVCFTLVAIFTIDKIMAKTLSLCVLFQMGVSGKTLDHEDPAVKSQRISKMMRTAATPIS